MVLGKNHKWFSQDVIVVTQTSAWPDGVLFFTILLWHTLKRSIALRKSSSNSRVSYGPKNKEIYHIWVMRSLPFESNPSHLTSTLNVPLSSKLVRNKCMGENALPNKFVSMDRWHWLLPSYYRSQWHLSVKTTLIPKDREWMTPKSSLRMIITQFWVRMNAFNLNVPSSIREWVRAGAAGAQTCRCLGHHQKYSRLR